MTTYRITNRISGVTLGEYEAETEDQALDLLAQDAGYGSTADIEARRISVDRTALKIEEVR